MPKTYFQTCPPALQDKKGFSLVELMVVLVIVGILATGVVMSFLNPTAKVKAAAFEARGDFNLARAEAVRRNDDILIDFVTSAQETCSADTPASFAQCFAGGNLHGYVICFDEGTVNDCSDEGATAADLEEKVIKTALFNENVKYYDIGATAPANGPPTAPSGDALTSNNGITFASDFFSMNNNGTSSDAGAVVIYYPAGTEIRGKPYAIEINNVSTGNVRLQRWRAEWDGGTWSTK